MQDLFKKKIPSYNKLFLNLKGQQRVFRTFFSTAKTMCCLLELRKLFLPVINNYPCLLSSYDMRKYQISPLMYKGLNQ